MESNQRNVANLDIYKQYFQGSPGITGADLRAWRKRCGFTQEMLRLALEVGSRQTIITWEKSTKRLPRIVEFALIGLEHAEGGHQYMTGNRFSASEQRRTRKQATF